MARYTTAGYGREVCEAAGECVYTPESSVVIEAGSCKPTTYVSRAILAGVWVAFFQRVPAIIVRTGLLHERGLGQPLDHHPVRRGATPRLEHRRYAYIQPTLCLSDASKWPDTDRGLDGWMLPGGCVYSTGSNHDPRRCWEGGHFDNDCRGNPRSVSCSDGPNGETFVRTLTDPNADAWGSADYTCTNPSVPEGTVSRAIIAGIWVAFFQKECQQ